MSEIQQLISDIQAFMAGSNQSYQPRLKAMYERYREQCVELAGLLAKCRGMLDSGLGADARSFNLQHKPTLVQRFNVLNFPGRKEFVALCEDYDLEPMPSWDSDMVDWLNAPVGEGEVQVSSLMQQWRRVARKGSACEKIRVLRQIVVSSGVSGGNWKKNLADEERRRYAEIEAALPELVGTDDELDRLEEFSLELYSPQLLTAPKDELLLALQERLQPLQAARQAKRLEEVLARMQECYARQDVEGLKTCCADWAEETSNPTTHPTEEQRQTARDVQEFVRQHDEREAREQLRSRLVDEVSRMLEEGTPYDELERKYGELERLEMEFPQGLREQVEARREEHELLEHRNHVRRCVYGVSLAILCLVLTGLGILFLQYRNRLHTVCAEMARLKGEGRFEEGLEVFETLKKDAPRVARASEVEVLVAELKQAIADREKKTATSQAEFEQIRVTIQEQMEKNLLESEELDTLLKRADDMKDYLTDDQNVERIKLSGRVSQAKEDIRQRREKAFLEACAQIRERISESQAKISDGRHEATVAEMKASLQALRQEFGQLLADSKVVPGVANQQKNLVDKECENLEETIKLEELYQKGMDDLANISNATDYLELLASYNGWPMELQKDFAHAYSRLEQWRMDMDDAALVHDFSEEKPEAELRLKEGGARTLFLKEYAERFAIGKMAALEAYGPKKARTFMRHELRFADEHGGIYYFYGEKPPEVEWDRRYAGYVNVVKFMTDCSTDGKETLAVFKYHADTGIFENRMAQVHPEWGVPVILKANGWNEKCPIADLLETMAQAKEHSRDELEAAAWNAFSKIAAGNGVLKDLNPAMRRDVLVNMLAMLVPLDEWYGQQLTPLHDNLTNIVFKSPWNKPDVCVASNDAVLRLAEALGQVDWQALDRQRTFLWEFRKALYARMLKPIGFLAVRNGVFSIRLFGDRLPGEMLVIERQELRKMYSDAVKGTVAQQDLGFLFNGQLVWGYSDGMPFGDFMAEWKEKGEKVGCAPELKTFMRPREYQDR